MKIIKGIFLLFSIILLFSNSFAQEKTFENLWYLKNEKRSLESYQKNFSKIDVVAPQVYFLKKDGIVSGKVPEVVLNLASRNNKKIMPLLANITFYTTSGVQKEYFDRPVVHDLLENPKNWEKVSKFMREEAYKYNFYGWQLDLENIDVKNRENLNNFVKYLSSEFKKDGLKLSIAVVSKLSDKESDYNIYEKRHAGYWKYWAGVFDYKTLGESTDFVSIMMYDMPNSRGPVATTDWQRQIINYSLTQIPKEKISFGLPSYGWAYRGNYLKEGTKHFTMVDFNFTNSKLTDFNKNNINNMTTGAGTSKAYGNISWVSYNKFGKNYTVWYEDFSSFKTKLEQIKNIAPMARGISVWVLGDEDKKIWELF